MPKVENLTHETNIHNRIQFYEQKQDEMSMIETS